MADASRNQYRVLGLQDPRLAYWADESSVTQATPRPGIPEPQNDNQALVLTASGTQSAAGEVEVLCNRGGFAEVDGGRFIWRQAGDTNYRGWDAPNCIVGYDAINVTSSTTINRYPHAITLRNQTDLTKNDYVLLAYTGSSATGHVGLRQGTGSPITWSSESTLTETGSSDYHHPCLVELPSGRILLFHMVYAGTDTGVADSKRAQVKVRYSDDQGSSWSVLSPAALGTHIDNSTATNSGLIIKRLRAAYSNGQILLVVWCRQQSGSTELTDEVLVQYASEDLGASFTQVELMDASADEQCGGLHDIVPTEGGFLIAYHQASTYASATSNVNVVTSRMGSAFEKISESEQLQNFSNPMSSMTGGVFDDDLDLAGCVDEDGAIYFNFLRTATVSNDTHTCLRSTDQGDTWDALGEHTEDSAFAQGATFYSSVSGAHPVWSTWTAQRGRILWISNWETVNGTDPWSLTCLYMGGYSTITMPQLDAFGAANKRVGWEVNYVPYDVPNDVGWGQTTTGTPTVSLTGGYLSLVTGAGETQTYRMTSSAPAVSEGIVVLFDVEIISGTGRMRVRSADGTNDYEVYLDLTTSLLSITDTHASAINSSGSGDHVQILVHLKSSKVSCWFRTADSDEDREWTNLCSNSSLTDGGTGTTTSRIRFGLESSSSEFRVYGVHFVWDEFTGEGPHSGGFTNPDDLFGRAFSGGPVYVDDGVRITATSGPAATDDEWHTPVRYEYGVANLLQGGPRQTWRATGTSSEQIAFTLGDEGDTSTGNDGIVVALLNSNVYEVEISGYDDDTSSWSTLGTFQTSDGMESLKWVRQGDGITYGATPAGDTPYFYFDELTGSTFSVGAGGFTYRITGNSEGKWDDNQKRPYLFLDGLGAGKGTSGTGGLVIPKNVAWYIPLNGAKYSGYRLTITAAGVAPAESYWEIGSVLIGQAAVFGYDTSWGRIIDYERAVELREADDGTIDERVLAPMRRTVAIGWTDGVDMSLGLEPDGDASPDFVDISQDTGHEPVASVQDTPYQAVGLVNRLAGNRFIYLPRVVKSNSVQTFNRFHELMYCRIDPTISLESPQGEESDTEVFRVPPIALREEL